MISNAEKDRDPPKLPGREVTQMSNVPPNTGPGRSVVCDRNRDVKTMYPLLPCPMKILAGWEKSSGLPDAADH